MAVELQMLNINREADMMARHLTKGDGCTSHHLARLIEADTRGAFQPFAEALAARLRDYLERWAELGITDPEVTLENEVYQLFRLTALDWDGLPCLEQPGEDG